MNRLLTTVVVGLAGIQGITLAAESRPKLVVGIMVDQLRTDYLENLKDMLGAGGFRRLMESGVFFKDVNFNVPGSDATSASAIIQTGTYPKFNGVPGMMIYDPVSKTLSPIYKDSNYIGNFTDETYSPAALRVTTLTDEIAVENQGKGRIHTIAPDAAQAITLAGHSANSAFWVNNETGKWSSTTYYPNPPAALQNKNYNTPLVSRLDTMKWQPLRKGEPYIDINPLETKEGFKYIFSRSDRDVYSLYKQSPYVNSDITQAATEYITDLNLGREAEGIDVLNLGYTLAPYPVATGDSYEYPLQDAYLRLDKDLERLFNTLDRQVGKENVLVYLVGTGYFAEPPIDNSVYRLPSGNFSVKRSMSLLNAFLSAKYGNGAYVDQYSDRQIYLSKPLLEEKNLDLNQVAAEARDFLMKMSGVADAYTLSDLVNPGSEHLESERLAIDPKTAGDIILDFNPGWTVTDDSRYPPRPQIDKSTAYATPGFIMGTKFAPKVVEETVEAVSIAPTIANALRIRAPNSASSKPIKLSLLQ
ncbi:MAG: alkaline phosphatase family protein [Muribaculaceae bacterium]|nr:alkaline phosphatase family protein [Muribaculaceae bacterium]